MGRSVPAIPDSPVPTTCPLPALPLRSPLGQVATVLTKATGLKIGAGCLNCCPVTLCLAMGREGGPHTSLVAKDTGRPNQILNAKVGFY